jgi:hypothetical protein
MVVAIYFSNREIVAVITLCRNFKCKCVIIVKEGSFMALLAVA